MKDRARVTWRWNARTSRTLARSVLAGGCVVRVYQPIIVDRAARFYGRQRAANDVSAWGRPR